jgi:hypothetical protein
MKGFHWYVQLMVTPNVQDTQCGFKLFTRRAAKSLFGSLHLYRWAFDTELIYLAERLHIPIAEVDMVTRLMYILSAAFRHCWHYLHMLWRLSHRSAYCVCFHRWR